MSRQLSEVDIAATDIDMTIHKYARSVRLGALALTLGLPIAIFMVARAGIDGQSQLQPPRPMRSNAFDTRLQTGDYTKKVRASHRAFAQQFQAWNAQRTEIIAYLRAGTNVTTIARRYGLSVSRTMKGDPNGYVLRASSAGAMQAALASMKADTLVRGAFENRLTMNEKAFYPNDPYFLPDLANGWPGQWHLVNKAGAAVDVNIIPPWAWGVTGTGVTLGIVDDGLETAHPDLSPNYDATDSYDFGQTDADPNPVTDDDNHGTAVAGIAAARGGNGIGVTGAAPQASLAGLRVDFVAQDEQQFADATTYHSSGTNTTIKVKNHSYGVSTPYIAADAELFALATSAAAGTIHVFSAGNERGYYGQDSNKMALQSSTDAITVAALADDARYALYSNFGANVFCTAPSSGAADGVDGSTSGRFLSITTTDRTTAALGYNSTYDTFPNVDYTAQFGGTSASAPLVSGIMALAKQVCPDLNVRMAKHLLARTCDIVHSGDTSVSSDGGWKTNSAGLRFDQNYGFGMIDAQRFVAAASRRPTLTAQTTESSGTVTVNQALPDNDPTGVTKTFTLTGTTPLEDVLVNLDITHPFRGDVEAYLTSPSGLRSRLMIRSESDDQPDISWTFTTNAFWGEKPAGTWTLKVVDCFAGDTGTWNTFKVDTHMGELKLLDAACASQNVPAAVAIGKSFTATITMKNTGSLPWTQAAGFRIGSQNPQDTTRWGYTRWGFATTDNIVFNASKTFSMTLNAPTTAGAYNFQWKMLQNGVAWFGDLTPNVVVNVVNPNDSQFVSINVPTTIAKSTSFTATVTMKNTGANVWTAAAGYRLGVQNPQDNLNWTITRGYLDTADSIGYGQTKTFTLSCKSPATAGTYNFQWKMLQSGVAWFGPTTYNIPIVVQ